MNLFRTLFPDLVVNQLEHLFEQDPARLLILPGLADIYIRNGLTGEGMQQITHMAHRLMVFSLQRAIITVVSAGHSPRNMKHSLAVGLTTSTSISPNVESLNAQRRYNKGVLKAYLEGRKTLNWVVGCLRNILMQEFDSIVLELSGYRNFPRYMDIPEIRRKLLW